MPTFLTNQNIEEVNNLVVSLGEPSYRAKQLLAWVYQKLAVSLDEMTDLPQSFRGKLAAQENLHTLTPAHEVKAKDRTVKVLSGGQKRRLGLAMELVSDPKILLCDEVTSGLDPRSEREIVRLLHDLSRKDGRIVLSVTHSLAHLELYDSILVLHEGAGCHAAWASVPNSVSDACRAKAACRTACGARQTRSDQSPA